MLIETKPYIILSSFGLKLQPKCGGQPIFPLADFYIDCRGMPDAVNKPGIAGTGDSLAIQKWLEAEAPEKLQVIHLLAIDAISMIKTRRKELPNPFLKPFRITLFCAYGLHRSRATKHLLAKMLIDDGYEVEIQTIIGEGK